MTATAPPEGLAAGTIVVRDRNVVYASPAAAAIVGLTPGDLLGRRFRDFVAPEERDRVVERYERRLRGEPVPDEYELTLVLPDGRRRLVECVVGLEGADLLVQLRDVTPQAANRPRLARLAQLGVDIQRERCEESIFARVREGLLALGLSSLLVRPEPDGVRVVWASLPAGLEDPFAARLEHLLPGLLGPWTEFSRVAWRDGAAFSDDWALHLAGVVPDVAAPAARTGAAQLHLSRAVAIRLEERAGPRFYLVAAGEWLRHGDLPALRLFGAQIAAALDAARTIADLSRRNAELEGLNELARLAAEPGDLATFLDRAADVALRALGADALAVFSTDPGGGALRRGFARGAPDGGEDPEVARVPLDGPMGGALQTRTARVLGVGDHPPAHRAPLAALGLCTFAWVPLAVRSSAVGGLWVGWRGALAPEEVRLDLVQAMASPFAGATESHALLADLRRRVSELTLLNDLTLASATLDPVLMVENALRRICDTFESDAAVSALREGDRLVLVAHLGIGAKTARELGSMPVGQGLPGLAVQRLAPVVTADMASGPGERTAEFARREGVKPAVAVPLLSKSEAVGVLLLCRRTERPYSQSDVNLLSAVGVQLGVAVESARLFADVRRRLSDLESVHALALRIFRNAPGDVHALLEDGCREASRALSTMGAVIALAADDGKVLRGVAAHGTPVPAREIVLPLDRDLLAAEAMSRRAPVACEDVARDQRSALFGRPGVPPMSLLAVPLTARDATRGVLFLADAPGRRFTAAEQALANALAGELAVGIENAELYSETRRRAEELGLLHEVGRSLVATLELPQVLDAGVRNLARIVDAPGAFLALLDPERPQLEVRAVAGVAGGERRPLPLDPPEANLAALAFALREPVVVEDALSDARVREGLRVPAGVRACLALPLLVRDRAIGATVILDGRGPRRFTPAEVERAAAIANQLAVAVENARLYHDLRRSYAELHQAQQQLIHQERLAALGELSAVVAHEVRNPLGVIFNSLGALRRLLHPVGDAKMLLDIVGEEADRLNRIVGDLLDFARPSTPVFRPERIDRIVDEAVQAALAQNPQGIALERDLADDLPAVPMDGRQVRQAVLNVAVNAVQAMPRGGRLTVRARQDGAALLLVIEDSGAGIPEEVRHRIFEPFFTTKASGTGLGLAVVKRILDGHGGRIDVQAREGGGTAFALRFPLAHPAAPAATPTGAGRVEIDPTIG